MSRAPLNLVAGAPSEPALTIGSADDPNTGAPVAPLLGSEPAVVDRAIEAAWRAWDHGTGPLSSRSLPERLALLHRVAEQLDRRADALAQAHATEVGIPIATARLFAHGLRDVVDEVAACAPEALAPTRLADDGRRVDLHLLPWGPAALYAPWNAPAFVAVTKVATAVAAGCPVVLKPSEHTPLTARLLVEALLDADIGPAPVQVVCGGAEVGAQLAGDSRIRMISYTGGTAGGRAVAAAAIARMTAMQLELSASNPAVVLPDADIEHAARELARGCRVLNGQWCEAPRRVYVHERDHDRLADALAAELALTTIGSSLDEDTDVGPLAHRAQFETVARETARLAGLGDAIAAHARVPSDGFFLSPTIVARLPAGAVRSEIFGPVLALTSYSAVDDAVAAANALDDGLAAYVFGPDRDEAHAVGRRLHAGEVRVGGCRVLDLAPGSTQAFWGSSGIGGHGRAATLRAHAGARIVGDEDAALAL